MLGILKSISGTALRALPFFKENKQEKEKNRHLEKITELENSQALKLANAEHIKKNFGTKAYQFFVFIFGFLLAIFALSPFLSLFEFMRPVLEGYVIVYQTLTPQLIMYVVAGVMGINIPANLIGKVQMGKGLAAMAELKAKKLKEDAETERVKAVAEITVQNGDYSFEGCWKKVMILEGGYVNDPKDTGGETYKGISRNNFGNWEGWDIIDRVKKRLEKKEITTTQFKKSLNENKELQEEVKEFYKEEFWDKLKCDEIRIGKIRFELFDTAINAGKAKSIQFVQNSINIIRTSKLEKKIEVDGVIGDVTLSALAQYEDSWKEDFWKIQNHQQLDLYIDLVEKDPETYGRFFLGWVRKRT